jgi:hypothetical protein
MPHFTMPQAGPASARLISGEYRELQHKLHENPDYGTASVAYAPIIAPLVNERRATEILVYGAGKGRLGEALQQYVQWPLKMHHYDPAVPEWSAPPESSTFVACIDVLEHIEPDLLDNVLDDLKRVTVGMGLFTVDTRAAVKVLADGRNAHLIQQPAHWWLPRITARFDLVTFNRTKQGFLITVEPMPPSGVASPP